MRIHVISRSSWHEPHRLRQQLSLLLSMGYDVFYHEPFLPGNRGKKPVPKGIELHTFPFLRRFGSVPLVSVVNAFLIYIYLRKILRRGDVLVNFLPELLYVPKRDLIKVVSVINDDFAAMSKRYLSWWVRYLLIRFARTANATLYVSSKLMKNYPSKRGVLFYPWADKDFIQFPLGDDAKDRKSSKNIILYWGYLTIALDYDKFEEMAAEIDSASLGYKIQLVGPVASNVEHRLQKLLREYKCVEVRAETDLANLDLSRVLFGVEFLAADFENGKIVEFPNKGPRLLAKGIPLVYSGCDLISEPYFIRYRSNLIDTINYVVNNSTQIQGAIQDYFRDNNSMERLRTFKSLIN